MEDWTLGDQNFNNELEEIKSKWFIEDWTNDIWMIVLIDRKRLDVRQV